MQVRTRVDTCTRGLVVWMQSALEPSASAADEGAEWCAGTSTRKRWAERRCSSLTAAVTRDVMKRRQVSNCLSPVARGHVTDVVTDVKGQVNNRNTFRAQYLENSWNCYLATIDWSRCVSDIWPSCYKITELLRTLHDLLISAAGKFNLNCWIRMVL